MRAFCASRCCAFATVWSPSATYDNYWPCAHVLRWWSLMAKGVAGSMRGFYACILHLAMREHACRSWFFSLFVIFCATHFSIIRMQIARMQMVRLLFNLSTWFRWSISSGTFYIRTLQPRDTCALCCTLYMLHQVRRTVNRKAIMYIYILPLPSQDNDDDDQLVAFYVGKPRLPAVLLARRQPLDVTHRCPHKCVMRLRGAVKRACACSIARSCCGCNTSNYRMYQSMRHDDRAWHDGRL